MCITFAEAKLSDTKLYAGEAQRGDTYVHVLAYQNKAASPGPNAMVLPLPAKAMPGEGNVIDTRGFRRFLDDIHHATRNWSFVPRGLELGSPEAEADVFDVGSYTVVLASSARTVHDALGRVPATKRPALNPDVLGAFETLYPGWPLALCCWDGTSEAEPLLWWYEPMFPDELFAPALDAHDGGPPRTDAEVIVDHHIAFGSTLRPTGPKVHYQDDEWIDDRRIPSWLAPHEPAAEQQRPPPPVATTGLLPPQVRGTRIQNAMPNGDFWLPTQRLRGPAVRRAPGIAQGLSVPLEGWV
ncbi:MAG: hypothetical protein U0359_20955 [Byssovorax sp.]